MLIPYQQTLPAQPNNTQTVDRPNGTSQPAVIANPAQSFTVAQLCKPMQNVLSDTQTAQKVRQIREKGVWNANITENTSFFGRFAQRLENVCLKLFSGNIDEKLSASLKEVKNWLCSLPNAMQCDYTPKQAQEALLPLRFLKDRIEELNTRQTLSDVTDTLNGLIELTKIASKTEGKIFIKPYCL